VTGEEEAGGALVAQPRGARQLRPNSGQRACFRCLLVPGLTATHETHSEPNFGSERGEQRENGN
jgi:hypothetical protein